jgi:plastocyanin
VRLPLLALGLACALAAGACGRAAAPAPTSPAPAATATAVAGPPTAVAPGALAVHLKDFTIVPAAISVPAGDLALAVVNDGPTPHDLAIRDGGGIVVARTQDLAPGRSETLTAHLAAGTYTTFCALPGHESLGMRGTLTAA